MNGFRGVFRFKEKELGNDYMGSIIGDGAINADDALFEKAREDIVSSLSSGRVLNHHRNQAENPHTPRYKGLRQRPHPPGERTQAPSPQHGCLCKLVERGRGRGHGGQEFRRDAGQGETEEGRRWLPSAYLRPFDQLLSLYKKYFELLNYALIVVAFSTRYLF